jgi:hypothetical protein
MEPSPGSPAGPLQRETSFYRTFYIPSPEYSSFPQESPNRVPVGRDTLLPVPLVYPFIYVCPKKGALLQNGENIRSPSVEPHTDGRCTYNRVWPGSPRGLLMTLLPLPQWHATLGTILSTLAWVDQSPVSQLVVATPNRVHHPHLLLCPP